MTEASGIEDDTRSGPTASGLVAACEAAWADIQARHPELPPVVLVLGSGVQGGRLVKLGHWWQSQWLADGTARGEVLLAGEALHLPAEDVFEVLLHEAAHGINCARGIKDTSRGGRYHNQLFKATGTEVGLHVRRMDPYGWAATNLRPETIETYRASIDRIAEHLRIARALPRQTPPGTGINGNGTGTGTTAGQGQGEDDRRRRSSMAACGCGRNLRIAPGVLAKGPVLCGLCSTEFAPKRIEHHLAAASAPTDGFLVRRAADLASQPQPTDPMQEGLALLDVLEQAMANVAARTGDSRALDVFRREKDGNVAWLDELTDADVVDLDGRRPRSGEPEIDLRTVELPTAEPAAPSIERPGIEIDGPGR